MQLKGFLSHILRNLLYLLRFLVLFISFLCAALSTATELPESKTAAVMTSEVTSQIDVQPKTISQIDPDIIVRLEGETLENSEVRRGEDGSLYVNAMPIFSALNNSHDYDTSKNALIIRRSQDNVVMELYTDTGVVKANGKTLGKLRTYGEVSKGSYLLTPNAVAVLSGLNTKFDKETKTFNFELDARLKIATGFETFVNEVSLGPLNPGPKSVGPVLVLPLLPIAEALGHDVSVIEGGNVVRVRRAQDTAIFTLDLTTGLVKLRGRPYGVTRDINYIDPVNLLLPVNAIETLTGTYVSTSGLRIDIDLDERLQNNIAPGDNIEELAKSTPFTPENLAFHLGPDTINEVRADFRMKSVNGQLRYEVPDLPTKAAELEPSWLSVDFAHINGIKGSVGDYSADFRELDGVGLRRVRGVAAVKETKKGRISATIGMPATGARQISNEQSRITYSGLAAGARYAHVDGWEGGAALKYDSLSGDQMAVLSAISGKLGRKKDAKLQWDAQADIGVFSGPARESNADLRFHGIVRSDFSRTITADASLQYNGAEFLRSRLEAEEREELITDQLGDDVGANAQDTLPDTRVRGLDQASLGASLRFTPKGETGFLKNPAASVRANYTISGLLKGGNEDRASELVNAGISAASGLGNTGLSISADATVFQNSFGGDQGVISGHSLSARAYKQFENISVRAQYRQDKQTDSELNQFASVTASGFQQKLSLPKNALVTVSPTVSGIWSGEDASIRGSMIANFNSGDMFGPKNQVNASLGVIQSLSSNSDNRTDKYLTVSAGRRLPVGKNMVMGLSYRNNLDGDHRIGLQLDGRFTFNEKRSYSKTLDGRGVLKGRSFHDENRDGIKQENEPAIGGALIRIKGTQLAVRTDRAGYFTIQNIKEGLYEVRVDGRSLPIGFALSESVPLKATIGDGQITSVPLPIVQRGQIRGFAFEDSNGDGKFTTGEKRLEGIKLSIKSTGNDANLNNSITTMFGQYAFDDLAADSYIIEAVENSKLGILGGQVEVELDPTKDFMSRINIPVQARTVVREVQVKTNDPPDKDTMTLSP